VTLDTNPHDRQMDQVLLFLIKNMTVSVSGEKLAKDLGISHSKISRVVDRLRSSGVEIQGEPFSGFRLKRLPDVVIPEVIEDRLHTGELGHSIHHLYSVDSTNAFALRLLSQEKQSPHGTLVLAEQQTAGRGRLGRRWVSPAGLGLYLTLIIRPQIPSFLAPLMTLAAAVAAHESIERVTGLDVDIKWPNDLLVGPKKVCGILCELQAELDRVRSITMGLGINVNQQEFPGEISEIATSLSIESGRRQSRIEILLDFLSTFERLYTRFTAIGPEVVTEAWTEASSFAHGRTLEVHDGVRTISGVTDGLSPLGVLRLRQPDGSLEEVYSGDVIRWE
jgi:BirA family biotin operon repressor/biotin-[acetyl-CoA-carboxylase] ligase